jgi:hypothetical protein
VLAALCAIVAVGVWARSTVRPALVIAIAIALFIWLAEGLGGVFTGAGTDPNTGPLLILLAACYWPRRSLGAGTVADVPARRVDSRPTTLAPSS